MRGLIAAGGVGAIGSGVLAVLIVCGLVGGIGITALGPGGVLVTIGLFALTGLSPATVAGTAIVTHVGTGLLATGAYVRSGQLREPLTRRTAWTLATAAVVGTPVGILVNSLMSGRAFGVLLGAFVAVVALLVLYRDRRTASQEPASHPRHRVVAMTAVGFVVAAASGLFGVGGPLLAVPLLVVLGVPVLPALGAAQAQSVVIASVGTVGYLAQGDISWSLALLVGVPELVGVLVGWKLARTVPTRGLKYALVAALLLLAPYLALGPT